MFARHAPILQVLLVVASTVGCGTESSGTSMPEARVERSDSMPVEAGEEGEGGAQRVDASVRDAGTPDREAGALSLQRSEIAVGNEHSCGVTRTGAVKCWGQNIFGQLGNGTTTDSLVAVQVVGLSTGLIAVASGAVHSCALTALGAVSCWGRNGSGQLGNNTTSDSSVPVPVAGLATGVVAIAAGSEHTCALTSLGAVKCWGRNDDGELGNNETTDRHVPVDVSGLGGGIQSIALGYRHTCAVTTAGGVMCWGKSFPEALTSNGTVLRHLVPVAVPGLASGIATIALGGQHSCALTIGGGVKCWGENASSMLGTGTGSASASATPVDVVSLGGSAMGLALGVAHTCAVLVAGGTAKCWGFDLSVQRIRLAPEMVQGLDSASSGIASKTYHTCAATSAGGVKCWGRNTSGQLGNNSTLYGVAAVEVVGF